MFQNTQKRRALRSGLEDNSGKKSRELRVVQIPISLNVIWRSLVMLERIGLVHEFENCLRAKSGLPPVCVWLIR